MIGLLRIYQMTISPLIGPRCRFVPSCSQYAIEACQEYSPLKACWITFKRLIRCHPFCEGGYDPVPQRKKP